MKAGSITFSTALDNEQLEKDLQSLTKKIEKKEREITELTEKRDQAQGTLDSSKLEAEKATLEQMVNSQEKFGKAEEKFLLISREIEVLEQQLSEQESKRLSISESIQKTKEAILSTENELAALEAAPKGQDDVEYKKKLEELRYFLSVARPAVGNMETSLSEYDKDIQKTAASLDALREKSDKALLKIPENVSSDSDIAAQKEKVKELQSEWDQAKKSVDGYTAQLTEAENELHRQQDAAGGIVQELDKAKKESGKMKEETEKARKRMDALGKRLKEILASAFIFNVLSAGLRQFTGWLGKSIKTNEEARQSIAQLKGALLTLAQPLVEIIIPAFTLFVNILTRIITAVAQFVSSLFGKTIKQSKDGAKALYKEANAIGAVGEAADEAAGSLAGFDEINTINTENAKGAGGGGATNRDEIAPDFSWMDSLDSGFLDRLKEIADLVAMVGAGFALWKIGTMLPGVLGEIASILGGILMTVGGLLIYWNGLTDAWENGVDWLNLIEMIGGLAAAAFGLYTLFGPIVAGIALVVGGLGMLITGFRDAMENGWNLQNVLLSISGILAAGLGIAMITGSWIPLLVAGIASVLLALTVATGHGEELIRGVQEVIEGFRRFFIGVFTGDIKEAVFGIWKIFDGLKISIGSVIDGIRDTLISFLDWLDEKTEGRFHSIIETAKGFVTESLGFVKRIINTGLDYIRDSLTGLVKFIGGVFTLDWEKAWEGLEQIIQAPIKAILGWIDDIISLVKKAIDAVKGLINQERSGNSGSGGSGSFDGSRISASAIPPLPARKIPALARGAVIPPNREFLAVLGDQRNGTNLEAPEDLIRQIVREESGGGNAELLQMLQAILAAIKAGHIIMVDGTTLGRTAIREINNITISAGKQMLKI